MLQALDQLCLHSTDSAAQIGGGEGLSLHNAQVGK